MKVYTREDIGAAYAKIEAFVAADLRCHPHISPSDAIAIVLAECIRRVEAMEQRKPVIHECPCSIRC